MQEKQDQKLVFVSLSIHTNFEHEQPTKAITTTTTETPQNQR